MRIKELCEEERPREKMLSKGAGAMSNAELLAILIGSGTRNENVLEVANRLLNAGDGLLSGIAAMDKGKMEAISGIGLGKYSSIAAAFELGKRLFVENSRLEKVPVADPLEIFKVMLPLMKGLDHEEFWIIFLNKANYIIHKEMFSMGGSSSTVVDPKLVLKKTLERKASSIIMVHNHPSGNPKPSTQDRDETRKMMKAAGTFGISLLDHIILCDDGYFSFSDGKVHSATAFSEKFGGEETNP
ncbi:MAG: DNA repair protein RadC [Bacteroidales bacterium]|nr:DNA repair protein RadC [Bacteroidales bacterium]